MNIFSDSFKKEAPLLGLQGSGGGLGYLAGGTSAADPVYVDDVFSTYLYTGNGSTQTITNGIDLVGKGGLVWIKTRTASTNSITNNHYWQDSERLNFDAYIASNNANPQNAFNRIDVSNDGFSTVVSNLHESGIDYASWTFRKAPGFFDVVTYTGTDGAASQVINHSLGSVPGVVIIKRTSGTAGSSGGWGVYHRSLGTGVNGLLLNSASNAAFQSPVTSLSSTTITVDSQYNGLGDTYVVYLFAHDEAVFGENEDQSVIKCGSYTGNGTTGQEINLGFEPQWVLIKRTDSSASWNMFDNMRGWIGGGAGSNGDSARIYADTDGTETNANGQYITPNGFYLNQNYSGINNSSGTYIYIAIRRPHKPPSSGTDVFIPLATRGATDGTPSNLAFTSNFPVDLLLYTQRNGGANSHAVIDRMRGGNKLLATSSNAIDATTDHRFDSNDGVYLGSTLSATSIYGGLLFRRAPGFMDILTYSGTGSVKTENHNLTVAPEMMWIKKRGTTTGTWQVYHSSQGNTKYSPSFRTDPFYTSSARWNDTSPTSTQFTLGTDNDVNGTGHTYVAYLFATLPGISKVGSYSGTGSSQDIDCGFTNGARFVLIKRADSELQGSAPDRSNWYLWDSARGSGIVTGDDPWIALNESTAEVTNTDYIDPLNAGFTVSSTGTGLNAVGGTYIYLAIA